MVEKYFPGETDDEKHFSISRKTFKQFLEQAFTSGQEYEVMMLLVCINSGDVPDDLENDPEGLMKLRADYFEKMNVQCDDPERTFEDLKDQMVKDGREK
jgi:hypothetical protein